MDEGQIVAGFLFPPDEQASGTICPGVAAFDHPSASTLSGTTLHLNFALAGNVWSIAEASRDRYGRPAAIALVQTEMLLGSSGRLRTRHGNRSQRVTQQFGVVNIGARDRDAQRHAAGVRYDRSLDSQFTPIGRVFTGFFPHLTAPWSWSRPMLANASRCRGASHRSSDTSSRSDGSRVVVPIPESTDGPYLVNRTAAASLSTGSQSAADKKFRWQPPADSHEA